MIAALLKVKGTDLGDLSVKVMDQQLDGVALGFRRQSAKEELKGIKGLKFFAHSLRGAKGSREKEVVEALSMTFDCPLGPMQSHFESNDIAVFEDLSQSVMALSPLKDDTSPLSTFFSEIEIPKESFIAIVDRGRVALSTHEQRCVGPKMVHILKVTCESDPDYWQALGALP